MKKSVPPPMAVQDILPPEDPLGFGALKGNTNDNKRIADRVKELIQERKLKRVVGQDADTSGRHEDSLPAHPPAATAVQQPFRDSESSDKRDEREKEERIINAMLETQDLGSTSRLRGYFTYRPTHDESMTHPKAKPPREGTAVTHKQGLNRFLNMTQELPTGPTAVELRSRLWKESIERRLEEQRARMDRAKYAECTFQPHVDPAAVCGKSRSSSLWSEQSSSQLSAEDLSILNKSNSYAKIGRVKSRSRLAGRVSKTQSSEEQTNDFVAMLADNIKKETMHILSSRRAGK